MKFQAPWARYRAIHTTAHSEPVAAPPNRMVYLHLITAPYPHQSPPSPVATDPVGGVGQPASRTVSACLPPKPSTRKALTKLAVPGYQTPRPVARHDPAWPKRTPHRDGVKGNSPAR